MIDTYIIYVDGLERCFTNIMMIFITAGFIKRFEIYMVQYKRYIECRKILMMNDMMIERSAKCVSQISNEKLF